MKKIQVKVNGKVQGVWFRQSTKQVAQELGIVGYAHNLPDSSVDVVAIGEEESIRQLIHFLEKGPELALVTGITISDYHGAGFTSFTTD
ncbi:acylphosphatase [Psychrobium sp. 1_MG-2023]|uniref:acylphosphatase n=1 Tax=Psychrobium sp. 1_MG-2023 TaxID=3062624 RepID=UPI000C33BCA2|nr:acylphosphatase [Psychrobium sp. 1_MG-2023]MDP2562668.1 acylphosphatase [Psychrobium sp. 1_MG-2023]PKF53804.1 acylphosphatase [Alteromonadales bacterium alter-6D02]